MSEENVTTSAEDTQQDNANKEVEKTFTQDEVNSLLAEQKRKVQAKYENHVDPSKLDELRADAYEKGKSSATNALLGQLIDTEIRSTATALGFTDASDAITFFGDKDSITYDPETGLDSESIKTRLSELAELKPYLLKTEQSGVTTSSSSRPRPKSGEPVQALDQKGSRAPAALRQLNLK